LAKEVSICAIVDGITSASPASSTALPYWQNLALPVGATINPDASVTLRLDHPFTLDLPANGNDPIKTDHIDQLVFRRLDGSDVRKTLAAPDNAQRALTLSLCIPLAKLALIHAKIDERDRLAANDIVKALLGGLKLELPASSEKTPKGISLRLRRAVVNTAGAPVSELHFVRLTATQKVAVLHSPSPMDWGLATATGISPKAAKALVDQMDGADAMDINMIVLGLCGSPKVSL
jgi:hypothetical protein